MSVCMRIWALQVCRNMHMHMKSTRKTFYTLVLMHACKKKR